MGYHGCLVGSLFGPKEGPNVPCLGAMGIRWCPMGPRWHKSQRRLKTKFLSPQKFWFSISISIFWQYWFWFWYWFWIIQNFDIDFDIENGKNFDIDIDFDIEEFFWRILILILILKTHFQKILILILNENFILSHVCCAVKQETHVKSLRSFCFIYPWNCKVWINYHNIRISQFHVSISKNIYPYATVWFITVHKFHW